MRFWSAFSSLLVLVPVTLVACSAGHDEDDGVVASEDPIRGGHVETGEPAVGLLMPTRCTGTLIAPDLVLTAGHCVSLTSPAKMFYTGQGRAVEVATDALSEMVGHEVKAGERAPGWTPGERCPSNDVGLVKLARPVEGITPAKVTARVPNPGEKCTAVGFGGHPTEGGGSTRAEKRSATVAFRETRASMFAFDDVTGGTEDGDSGGPLLCDGTIVAVNSCSNRPDLFARIDQLISWIEAKKKSWASP